jgi:LysM repeat protein
VFRQPSEGKQQKLKITSSCEPLRAERTVSGIAFALVIFSLFLGAAPASADSPDGHTVAAGENLYRIALRYNTTVSALMSANGLSSERIAVGQNLRIPVPVLGPQPEQGHTVAPGENLYRIAQAAGTTVEELMAVNGITEAGRIFAGQVLRLPTDEGRSTPPPTESAGRIPETQSSRSGVGDIIYIVDRGENLYRIALKFGIPVDAIIKINGLANADRLVAGTSLTIPVSGTGASTVASAAVSVSPPVSPAAGAPVVQSGATDLFRLTHYCLVGPMSSGRWVYMGAVAADQSVFPLGTRLRIDGRGHFSVEDRFASAAGVKRLDVWVPSCEEAMRLGVEYRRVSVLSRA